MSQPGRFTSLHAIPDDMEGTALLDSYLAMCRELWAENLAEAGGIPDGEPEVTIQNVMPHADPFGTGRIVRVVGPARRVTGQATA